MINWLFCPWLTARRKGSWVCWLEGLLWPKFVSIDRILYYLINELCKRIYYFDIGKWTIFIKTLCRLAIFLVFCRNIFRWILLGSLKNFVILIFEYLLYIIRFNYLFSYSDGHPEFLGDDILNSTSPLTKVLTKWQVYLNKFPVLSIWSDDSYEPI